MRKLINMLANMFDKECAKERFKGKRMYCQAMMSYCKNNTMEVLVILNK